MLKRKIASLIEDHLRSGDKRVLIIDGARQVGKTYIVREVGNRLFPNFIEINMIVDRDGDGLFKDVHSVRDFLIAVSSLAGDRLDRKDNTLIFIDEIQAYPHLFSLLKFLVDDNRYTYIASGSLLGVTLMKTPSLPVGYTRTERMYPLDWEEFLWANGYGQLAIDNLKEKFITQESLDESQHSRLLSLFRQYLLIGGLPQAVATFMESLNISRTRSIHKEIIDYYKADASQYDAKNRLVVHRIYDMIPSNMENRKKRMVVKDIEDRKGRTNSDYMQEYEYLICSGIALNVQAVSNPSYPLRQSQVKNLVKFYLNDPGLLSYILYADNVKAVLTDERSINLGSLYETACACCLVANGHALYYYDNREKGEVDFLIDDCNELAVLPLEIKSGRDYRIHSAISRLISNPGYNIRKGIVLSNERVVENRDGILYLPIYHIMSI